MKKKHLETSIGESEHAATLYIDVCLSFRSLSFNLIDMI